MSTLIVTSMIVQAAQFLAVLYLAVKYVRLRDQKENEYYTDYVHNNLVLRVYKHEFEYQAAGNISTQYLLDRGRLSVTHDWVLIDKRGLQNSK